MRLSRLLITNIHVHFWYVQCSRTSDVIAILAHCQATSNKWVYMHIKVLSTESEFSCFAFICMGDLYISASWSCLSSSLIEHHTYSLYSAGLASQIVVIIPWSLCIIQHQLHPTQVLHAYTIAGQIHKPALSLHFCGIFQTMRNALYMDQHKGTTKRHVHKSSYNQAMANMPNKKQ